MVIIRFIFVFTSFLFTFAIGYAKGRKDAYNDCIDMFEEIKQYIETIKQSLFNGDTNDSENQA